MTPRRSTSMALILPAVVIVTIGSASPRGAQSQTFRSGVDMVALTVTVTDPNGKYMTGLTDKDFTIFEDGVEQPLTFFASDAVPLDVALLVDTSSSMQADLPLVQAAASGLVRRLRDCDRGAVVEIKGAASIPRPLTSDRALIERHDRFVVDIGYDSALRRPLHRAQGVRARTAHRRRGQASGCRAAVRWARHPQSHRVR